MPQGLDFPSGTEFWAAVIPPTPQVNEQYIALYVIGRLAPGATHSLARAEMTAFLRSARDFAMAA